LRHEDFGIDWLGHIAVKTGGKDAVAVAETVTFPETVVPAAGAVIVTESSGSVVNVKSPDAATFPPASPDSTR